LVPSVRLQPLSRVHQELIKFKLFVGQALNILQTLALPCARRDRCRDLYALSRHDGRIGHGGTLVRNNLSVAAHGRLLICTSDLHCRNVILKVTPFIKNVSPSFWLFLHYLRRAEKSDTKSQVRCMDRSPCIFRTDEHKCEHASYER